MRIVAASDLHLDEQCRFALLRQAREADLVVIAGDLAQRREGLTQFLAPLESIAHKLVMVPGNNETDVQLRNATSATVLHGETVEIEGVVIAGIGGAIPPLPPLPWGSFDLTEKECDALLSDIQNADLMISHSPPNKICDWHRKRGNIGSEAILRNVERIKPKFLLCGHVHDCWGERGRIGQTFVANLGPVPVYFDI